jgi:hypothetical protein
MGQVSAKLRAYDVGDGWRGAAFAHWCPGCKGMHAFAVGKPLRNGAKWTFDGNLEAPTFAPSMHIRVGPYPSDDDEPGRIDVCHYFLRAGQIQFLGDSTHALKGQTVPLPDLPPEHQDKR